MFSHLPGTLGLFYGKAHWPPEDRWWKTFLPIFVWGWRDENWTVKDKRTDETKNLPAHSYIHFIWLTHAVGVEFFHNYKPDIRPEDHIFRKEKGTSFLPENITKLPKRELLLIIEEMSSRYVDQELKLRALEVVMKNLVEKETESDDT